MTLANGSPIVIEVPSQFSLLEERARPFLEKLRDSLESKQKVIIWTKTNVSDFTATWEQELSETLLIESLAMRIWDLRQLFKQIQNSKKYCFLGSGDCLGTWWELALACSARLWNSHYPTIGFPAAYVGLFPSLGVIEHIGRKPSRTKSRLAALKKKSCA